jgi:hypothetical protein
VRDAGIAALPALLVSLALAIPATPVAGADAKPAAQRAELTTRIKTIGLMPLEIEQAIADPDEVTSRLEGYVTERLQGGGFTVVPASEMRAIRGRALASLGGVYDPLTGLPNRERLAALQEFSAQEYRMQHPVDATLHLSIVRRPARFEKGWSEWDGVRERVTSKSGIVDALERGMELGIEPNDEVPALSLVVTLIDAQGETLYKNAGGLLLLAYPTTLSGMLFDYDLARVDPKFGLGDPAIAARALSVALDPLITGVVPHTTLEFKLPQPRNSPARPATLADLRRDHRRVALAAMEIPTGVEQGESVQARYHKMIAAKVTALGFEVVGGNDFDDLWSAERAAAGGFYDPLSGLPDLGKLNTALARVLATLRERYDVAGVIRSSIVPRKASCKYGYAYWDGVSEPVSGGGSAFFNSSIFNPEIGYTGQLEANSLKLRFLDGTGQVLYQGLGGVQLTKHLDHGRSLLVPETALFADPARDAAAVGAALHELLQQSNKHN